MTGLNEWDVELKQLTLLSRLPNNTSQQWIIDVIDGYITAVPNTIVHRTKKYLRGATRKQLIDRLYQLQKHVESVVRQLLFSQQYRYDVPNQRDYRHDVSSRSSYRYNAPEKGDCRNDVATKESEADGSSHRHKSRQLITPGPFVSAMNASLLSGPPAMASGYDTKTYSTALSMPSSSSTPIPDFSSWAAFFADGDRQFYLTQFQKELKRAVVGLQTLKSYYPDDSLTQTEFEMIENRLSNLLDRMKDDASNASYSTSVKQQPAVRVAVATRRDQKEEDAPLVQGDSSTIRPSTRAVQSNVMPRLQASHTASSAILDKTSAVESSQQHNTTGEEHTAAES